MEVEGKGEKDGPNGKRRESSVSLSVNVGALFERKIPFAGLKRGEGAQKGMQGELQHLPSKGEGRVFYPRLVRG